MVAKNIRPSMTFKTILAPVSGAAGSERVLDTALSLARHFGAHVEVLHVSSDPRDAVPLVGEGMSGAMVEEIVQLAEKEMSGRARAARNLYDDRLAKAPIPVISTRPTPAQATGGTPSVSWRQEVGREDEVVAVRGRIFDLVVVGRPGGDADQPSETTLEAALLESGRPIVVAPPTAGGSIGLRVAVAWNGAAESARAVMASRPFLIRADSVHLLVGDESDENEARAEDLVEVLAWHSVPATVHRFRSDGKGIGAALLSQATALNADMMVMGGYGRSRLRQLIFGGATSHVIYAAGMPLFMIH